MTKTPAAAAAAAAASTDQLDQQFANQAEADLMAALGISDTQQGAKQQGLVNNDHGNPGKMKTDRKTMSSDNNNSNKEEEDDDDLAGLAELLPEVNGRRKPIAERPIMEDNHDHDDGDGHHHKKKERMNNDNVKGITQKEDNAAEAGSMKNDDLNNSSSNKAVLDTVHSKFSGHNNSSGALAAAAAAAPGAAGTGGDGNDTDFDYPDSENALDDSNTNNNYDDDPTNVPKEFVNNNSSAQSISTATRQTHDVKMPMYLPNFIPATGCTNASDFIVRCFVARLRSGITVVKHGRSRWCKSRLRVLQIHPDGRSLSWKPAEGEPTSNKKPPRLDLTTCLEVRHAWSPDPQNPMYTGTPILRQKCEAANAHKSFALIFKNRTVDITGTFPLFFGYSRVCLFRFFFLSLFLTFNRPPHPYFPPYSCNGRSMQGINGRI
jgi:hypothetical protein